MQAGSGAVDGAPSLGGRGILMASMAAGKSPANTLRDDLNAGIA